MFLVSGNQQRSYLIGEELNLALSVYFKVKYANEV